MANIKEIARLSDCSVSTVSRVINHHPYVSEEKRQRILAVMQESNYTPNRTAQNLSLGFTKNIGVMIPYTNQPYFDGLTKGIIDAAFHAGYKVTLLPTNYRTEVEQHYLEEFASQAFDGLIITSKTSSAEAILPYMAYGPIIFCEKLAAPDAACVYVDREQAYSEVFQYLKGQGKQHIGLTLGRNEQESNSANVLVSVYEKFFGPLSEQMIIRDCKTVCDGYRAGEIFSALERVDAIFANGDEIAAGIQRTLTKSDILLVSQENLLISQFLNISTIDYHLHHFGTTAFHQLLTQEKQKITIPYTFIKRDLDQLVLG